MQRERRWHKISILLPGNYKNRSWQMSSWSWSLKKIGWTKSAFHNMKKMIHMISYLEKHSMWKIYKYCSMLVKHEFTHKDDLDIKNIFRRESYSFCRIRKLSYSSDSGSQIFFLTAAPLSPWSPSYKNHILFCWFLCPLLFLFSPTSLPFFHLPGGTPNLSTTYRGTVLSAWEPLS